MGLFANIMNNLDNTIFALSTPGGKSAIALIRISGKKSYSLVKSISKNMPKKPNIATFNEIVSKNNSTIDQTITTYFRSPKSFTGEDMVEISAHGGNAVVKKIFEILLNECGMRLASPGEFTRRAFENNKLDLTQVEAIADIVNAETEKQRKQAISHLSGHFFKSSKSIHESLKRTLANIEATIDFTEDDLPENIINDIKEQIENIIGEINILLRNSKIGISIRDGFLIFLLGKPNAGKSSFINTISGKDISIVTDQPGTTRDLIESFLDVSGYPVKFVDTAGIRESADLVEKIGVEKAHMISKEADINIIFIQDVLDIKDFKDVKNKIFVKSKQDIGGEIFNDIGFYNISSKTNYGIENILQIIKEKIEKKTPGEQSFISRERHVQCLSSTLFHLSNSKIEKNIDLFAEDVRQALKSLSSLFGSFDIEDILDIIFSDFCIGK